MENKLNVYLVSLVVSSDRGAVAFRDYDPYREIN